MIEPTDEMRQAFRAPVCTCVGLACGNCLNHRLVAVLAIAERDLAARPRECGATGPDGAWCEREPGHDELHGFVHGAGLVRW